MMSSPNSSPTTESGPILHDVVEQCGSPMELRDTPASDPDHWDIPDKDWLPAYSKQDRAFRRNRTLILCFDGTGDSFDDDNSNIVQFISLLKKDDNQEQKVYYQTGIGTYTGPLLSMPLVRSVSKTLDQMVAWNLRQHVEEGYEFLMQNYTYGDKICIFGFSRGAYTARSLAGMLQKVGLLPSGNKQQVPFAYAMYQRDDEKGYRDSIAWKKTFAISVKIDFVGVFDTVASVGGLIPRYLPFASTNSAIRIFRHAMALDEHRVRFVPSFYTADTRTEAQRIGLHEPRRESSMAHKQAELINESTGQVTDSKEVMFAGAHCDVGGGSVKNSHRHSLARITLRWMVRETFRTNTGIIYDAGLLRDALGMDVHRLRKGDMTEPQRVKPDIDNPCHALAPNEPATGVINSLIIAVCSTAWMPFQFGWQFLEFLRGREPDNTAACMVWHREHCRRAEQQHAYEGEGMEELHDALSPIYDQMHKSFLWQLMEYLPHRTKRQADVVNEVNRFIWIINQGRGRKVFRRVMNNNLLIHQSVLTRLEALDEHGKAGTYVPLIRPNLRYREQKVATGWFDTARNMIFGDVGQPTHDQWISGSGDWFHWHS